GEPRRDRRQRARPSVLQARQAGVAREAGLDLHHPESCRRQARLLRAGRHQTVQVRQTTVTRSRQDMDLLQQLLKNRREFSVEEVFASNPQIRELEAGAEFYVLATRYHVVEMRGIRLLAE